MEVNIVLRLTISYEMRLDQVVFLLVHPDLFSSAAEGPHIGPHLLRLFSNCQRSFIQPLDRQNILLYCFIYHPCHCVIKGEG